ncbi:hypothetical protein ACLOJK_004591 [Asimina triloba]
MGFLIVTIKTPDAVPDQILIYVQNYRVPFRILMYNTGAPSSSAPSSSQGCRRTQLRRRTDQPIDSVHLDVGGTIIADPMTDGDLPMNSKTRVTSRPGNYNREQQGQSSGGLRKQILSDQQQSSATSFIGSDHDPADQQRASGEGIPKSASQAADALMASTARAYRSGITISGRSSPSSSQSRIRAALPKSQIQMDGLKPTLYRTAGLARLTNLQTTISFSATTLAADRTFDGDDAIPSLREPFSKFLSMYPKFQSSEQID